MPELVCAMKPQRWWSLDDASLTSLILSNPYAEMSTAKVVRNPTPWWSWPRWPYNTRETGPYCRSSQSIELTVSPQKLCVNDPLMTLTHNSLTIHVKRVLIEGPIDPLDLLLSQKNMIPLIASRDCFSRVMGFSFHYENPPCVWHDSNSEQHWPCVSGS